MQWQHEFLRTVAEVIPKEANGSRPAPLFLKEQAVEIVVDINEKSTGQTTNCRLGRAGRYVRGPAEYARCGEMCCRHHAAIFWMCRSGRSNFLAGGICGLVGRAVFQFITHVAQNIRPRLRMKLAFHATQGN